MVAFSRAASVWAESASSFHGRDGPEGSAIGASSRITWALVPPMPREVTPARRGTPSVSQSRSSVLTKNGLLAKSICGFGRSKWRLGGICRCSRASTALISPQTPAAESRWPMLLLSEPMAQKFRRPVWARNAWVRAAISIGSPIGVAVPWHST